MKGMGQQVGLPRLGKWIFSPLRWVLIRFFPVTYLNLQYRYVTGHRLKLFNPTTYTEKLQYLRHVVFPKDPLVIRGTDRVAVRAYLKEKKLTAHLIPVLGIYKRVEDIDWESLPKQFVMKCSHASGFNRIIFDKAEVNVSQLKRQFRRWLATDYGLKTLERHYSPIPRNIIIEKYLGVDHSLPIEYKLHVFHGVVKYLYVVTGRNSDIRYTHFLRDWTPFPGAQFNGWKSANYPVVQPENFAKMIAIAEKLAAPFPFVRVDLYNLKGKIYFSELTFTPAKGTLKLVDAQIDTVMGGWLSIG